MDREEIRQHPQRQALKTALKAYDVELEALDFPGVKRDEEGNKVETNYREADGAESSMNARSVYMDILNYLEGGEVELQETAAHERQGGHKKGADNLAKFYDGIIKTAKILFDNPEADFHFSGGADSMRLESESLIFVVFQTSNELDSGSNS